MCRGRVVLPMGCRYSIGDESVTGVPSLLCCSVDVVKWIKMLIKLLIIRDDNQHQLENLHQTGERPCGLGIVSLFPHSDGVLEQLDNSVRSCRFIHVL